VDAAVYDVIRWVEEGKFRGGVYSFGLAEGGVGYIYDEHNRDLIPPAVHARLEQIQRDIVAGKIRVPTE
jgi:basic membrane protein A